MKGELRRSAAERKSPAARKPWDEAVIFKALMLQALSNLSGDQTEYRLRDRLSFMRPVALSGGAGGGGRGGKVVRPPRRLFEGQRLSRHGERWLQALFARREER